jgi:hypothetical protein
MIIRFVVVLAMLLIGSCVPEPGGAVRPALPGPLDIIRGGVWGDYSGLCPKRYEFCHSGRRSICCPSQRGCCGDASGPYCCSAPPDRWHGSDGRDEDDRSEDDRGSAGYACDTRDLTCSLAGRTICCARSTGCCADEDGPYCCEPGELRERY